MFKVKLWQVWLRIKFITSHSPSAPQLWVSEDSSIQDCAGWSDNASGTNRQSAKPSEWRKQKQVVSLTKENI